MGYFKRSGNKTYKWLSSPAETVTCPISCIMIHGDEINLNLNLKSSPQGEKYLSSTQPGASFHIGKSAGTLSWPLVCL
jgi:hypothetical protein